MPKISDIEDKGKKGLDIPGLPWLKKDNPLSTRLKKARGWIGTKALKHLVLGACIRRGVKTY